jgi:hypothetical protein
VFAFLRGLQHDRESSPKVQATSAIANGGPAEDRATSGDIGRCSVIGANRRPRSRQLLPRALQASFAKPPRRPGGAVEKQAKTTGSSPAPDWHAGC